MTTTSTYDTRRFPLCAPWDGEVGVSFIRNFGPTFKAALATRTDKFSNLLRARTVLEMVHLDGRAGWRARELRALSEVLLRASFVCKGIP